MKRTFALALAALAITVAGCGSDEKKSGGSESADGGATPATEPKTTPQANPGGGASTKLQADADPGGALKFTKTSLTAKPGNVTITMENPSEIPHAVSIEGNGVDEDGKIVEKGGTSTVTANLKAGTYEFYCPVPGHEPAGMKGELTVK